MRRVIVDQHCGRREVMTFLFAAGVFAKGGSPLARGSNATPRQAVPETKEPNPPSLVPCIHQATTRKAGFRTAIEAYAKAGFRTVELWLPKLDEALQSASLSEIRRMLRDEGLKPVSAGGVPNLFYPRPAERERRTAELRKRLEQLSELDVPRLVSASTVREAGVKAEDFRAAIDLARQIGDIAGKFKITIMPEFLKFSTFLGSLTSVLELCREAEHSYVRPMLDTFHFYAGISKLEDLDLLRPGELIHLHVADVPAHIPRELLSDGDRILPGEGLIPLSAMLAKLKGKGYRGCVSLELFNPQLWEEEPLTLARKAMVSLQRMLS